MDVASKAPGLRLMAYQKTGYYQRNIRSVTIVPPMAGAVSGALEALQRGEFILVYDAEGREEETDLTIASQFVTPQAVRTLRRDGGGLICTTVDPRAADALGLPYLQEVLAEAEHRYPLLHDLGNGELKYDKRSSFSITINHRDTFTGVTDRDRARTITALAPVIQEALVGVDGRSRQILAEQFRSPGHVFLLRAADDLLEDRRGHTELATALTLMAGLIPSATICEMMGDRGGALAKEEAKKYARDRNLAFLEGKEILEAWRQWSGSWQRGSSTSSTSVTSITSRRPASSATSSWSSLPGTPRSGG